MPDNDRHIAEDSYVALVLILSEMLKAKDLAKRIRGTASYSQKALELISNERSRILEQLR
jgi:hypothetical protein